MIVLFMQKAITKDGHGQCFEKVVKLTHLKRSHAVCKHFIRKSVVFRDPTNIRAPKSYLEAGLTRGEIITIF